MDREDAVEIARLVNAARDGLVAGDGEVVCDSLVESGQEAMVTITERDVGVSVDDCEEAVEELAASLSAKRVEEFSGPRAFRAADVNVDPTDDPGFNDVTDTVPEGGPTNVQVSCLDSSGNVYFVIRQDDGSWKLQVPFCSGR